MSNGYGRSACSAEPQRRGDIIAPITDERSPEASFGAPKPAQLGVAKHSVNSAAYNKGGGGSSRKTWSI